MKFNFDKNTFQLLYYRFRDFLLPVGVILVSLLLLNFVVLPQVGKLRELQGKVAEKKDTIAVLSANNKYLRSLDDTTLDNSLETLSQALPPDKDFISVIEAIEEAGIAANVAVSDFSFTVGDLSTASASLKPQLTLDTSLSVHGDFSDSKRFLETLMKSLPISEVKTVAFSKTDTTIQISFDYKPFSPFAFSDAAPIEKISASDEKIIAEVGTWNKNNGINSLIIPSSGASPSSESAALVPTPAQFPPLPTTTQSSSSSSAQ